MPPPPQPFLPCHPSSLAACRTGQAAPPVAPPSAYSPFDSHANPTPAAWVPLSPQLTPPLWPHPPAHPLFVPTACNQPRAAHVPPANQPSLPRRAAPHALLSLYPLPACCIIPRPRPAARCPTGPVPLLSLSASRFCPHAHITARADGGAGSCWESDRRRGEGAPPPQRGRQAQLPPAERAAS